MRKKIVAGNWKMNMTYQEAEDLMEGIVEKLCQIEDLNTDIIICPPYPYLEMAIDYSANIDEDDVVLDEFFMVGAQNCAAYEKGAYTGEVSAQMLDSMDVTHCIIGHSERRKYFGDTDEVLVEKVKQAIACELSPIFCVGEVLEEREAGKHFDVIRKQVEKGLFHLDKEDFMKCIIAYEPVWAIGTGKTATPEQAEEIHAFIRSLVAEKYGKDVAEATHILYGGSCNAKNASTLFAQPDVDGGLIGGASLKIDDFVSICQQASK